MHIKQEPHFGGVFRFSITRKQCDCTSNTKICNDVIYLYHADHLGSSTYITNSTGNEYQFLQYLPFGSILVEQKVAGQSVPYKFSGKELDEETGLYNLGARYYNPELGIFLSPDPLQDKYAAWTPYHYVLNNPLKWVDPTGMAPESPDWGWERVWNKETKQYDYKIVSGIGGNDFDILTTTSGSFKGGDLSSSQSVFVNETGGARLSDDMPGMWGGDIATGQATALDISDFIPQKGAAKGMAAMAAGFFGKKMAAKGVENLTKSQLKSIASLEKQIAPARRCMPSKKVKHYLSMIVSSIRYADQEKYSLRGFFLSADAGYYFGITVVHIT